MSLDQVDDIILHSLRSLEGCEISSDIHSVEELSEATILRAVLVCIRAIDDASEFSADTPIPRNMSSRVGLCSSLCEAIKQLGYREQLGYHQLMYKNAADNRRLLAWLISRLPNTDASGSSAVDRKDPVADVLQHEAKEAWAPPLTFSLRRKLRHADVWQFSAAPLLSPLSHFYPGVPLLTDQPRHPQQRAPSVLEYQQALVVRMQEWEAEWNTKGLASGLSQREYRARKAANVGRTMATSISASLAAHAAAGNSALGKFSKNYAESAARQRKATRFSQQTEFSDLSLSSHAGAGPSGAALAGISKEEREELRQKEREEELARLSGVLQASQEELAGLVGGMENFRANFQQMTANLYAEQKRHETLEQELLVKRNTMKLLPKAEENMQRLRELANQHSEKIRRLAEEWEGERVELVAAYRALRDRLKDMGVDAKSLLGEIRGLRGEIDAVKEASLKRYERYKQLLEVWNGLPKNISRETYTVRILDIVKQTKKQKVDIDKILIDTRNVNHEINNISQTLIRSFSVTSELVFTEAPKDALMKQAYRDLVGLDKAFQQLVEKVGQTGQLRRDLLLLEEKYTQLEKRTVSINLEQIQKDILEIRSAQE